MTRLGDRWDRRMDTYRDGREPFTAQSAAMIRSTPQAVWDLLDAPGVAILLDNRHQRTFHVPGTPEDGVGRQSCNFRLSEDGVLEVTVSEVIEHDPPFRSVRRILNTEVPIVEGTTLAEIPGGCSFAVSIGLRILAGTRHAVAPQVQAQLDEYVEKVKALAENGLPPKRTTQHENNEPLA